MYSYITKDNIFKRWQESKTYTDQLTNPFTEFQRIARNEPYPNASKEYPTVTDGTTASIVQKTPKRVVQQIPTGTVESDDSNDYLPIVAEFILTNKIIPYANEDYDLFEKTHLTLEGGLTFGSTATYTPFLNHSGYFCPDLTIPYWGDVFIQKGKKSARSSAYTFIRSWWQPEDIDALIDSETKNKDKAEKRNDTYDGTWDVAALEQVKTAVTSKDNQAQTPSEVKRSGDSSGIEFVTAFQDGVGAKFYTIETSTKTIVRTKVNKDPRGKQPIQWFFGDTDGTNPLGRGIVELIGPLQNLIDSDMQAYQYNRALALQPPVVKYGNVGKFSFAPNAVLDASDDPNAKIVPLTVDTSALTNYPALYGLQKSQLLNLVNSPDTSISSEIGNPGFSKTPAGINQNKATLSVDDNSIRKNFEAWFEDWAECAINLYFAERSGKDILQLDNKTAEKLQKLILDGKMDPSLLNGQNQLIVDYDTDTPALKFRVDASSSRMADDQAQLAALELIQQFLEKSPALQQIVPVDKQVEIYNSVVSLSGVENPEKLAIDMDELKKQLEQKQAAGTPQKTLAESMQWKPGDLTPNERAQALSQYGIQADENPTTVNDQTQQSTTMLNVAKAHQAVQQAQSVNPIPGQQDPQDQALIGQLRQLGVSDNVVSQAIDALNQGVPAADVIKHIQAQPTQQVVQGAPSGR